MQWEVVGTDEGTGHGRAIAVNADDATQARRLAARVGLTAVESVHPVEAARTPEATCPTPVPNPSAAPHRPSEPPSADAHATEHLTPAIAPHYERITKAANLLRALSGLVAALGGLCVLTGFFVFGFTVAAPSPDGRSGGSIMAAVTGGLTAVSAGGLQLLAAALGRLLAAAALAACDLAKPVAFAAAAPASAANA